jgi:hypothetical protein
VPVGISLADIEVVDVQAYLDVRVVGHPVEPRGVAVDRQTLVGSLK